VQVLLVEVGLGFLPDGDHAGVAALFEVGGEEVGLYPLAAVDALHGLAAFHHSFELLHALVLLLQHLATSLDLLEGGGEVFVGLEEFVVVVAFGGGEGLLEGDEEGVVEAFVLVEGVFEEGDLVLEVGFL
jgi:hypothetical protein